MTAVATERTVRHLSVDQLRDVLATQLNGAAPVGLSIRTEYRMKGGVSCPYKGRVVKETDLAGFVGFNYQRAVNKRRVMEGGDPTFVPSPRKWGERIPGTPLVEHNGEFYLEYTPLHYRASRLVLDGCPVTEGSQAEKDIVAWRADRSDNAAHQGLTKEFAVRTVALKNIRSIRCLGEDITVHRLPIIAPIARVVLVRDFAALNDGELLTILRQLLNEVERRQGQPV